MDSPKILALTPGDPAGIGPDLAITLAGLPVTDKVVIVADRSVLAKRAKVLGRKFSVQEYQPGNPAGSLEILHVECNSPVTAGQGSHQHADYVINTLNRAVDGCLSGEFNALVTGPINKEIMSRAGLDFMGHTEYLAHRTQSTCPVMLLTSKNLKVALVTTHIPLHSVSAHITRERILAIVRVLQRDLVERFGVKSPRIGVCGLNPHAGEGGKLGIEEVLEINPAIELLQQEGVDVSGPHPADTIFANHRLSQFDVILSMYHDQGLPVIKHGAFGEIVNVTLGLPIIRTSVDHGTAYDIAGSGDADAGSLLHAITLASQLASRAQT